MERNESLPLIFNHLKNFFTMEDEVYIFEDHSKTKFPVDIFWIKNTLQRHFQILFTAGISGKPMIIPEGLEANQHIELCMLLPENWKNEEESLRQAEWFWPIAILRGIGKYIHENNGWLNFGHTISNPPNETFPGTGFNTVILIKAISLPENFQKLTCENKEIEVLLLFPIFQSELDYKIKNGVFKLLELFDQKQVSDIINTKREPAV